MAQDNRFDTENVDIQSIIQIGFDALHLLIDRFRREMGRQFDTVLKDCLDGLEEFPRELFRDISLDKEHQDMNIYIIKARYDDFEGEKDSTKVLDAFIELITEITTVIKTVLGKGLVEEAVQEAIKVLSMVEKYQQDMPAVEYLIERLGGKNRP